MCSFQHVERKAPQCQSWDSNTTSVSRQGSEIALIFFSTNSFGVYFFCINSNHTNFDSSVNRRWIRREGYEILQDPRYWYSQRESHFSTCFPIICVFGPCGPLQLLQVTSLIFSDKTTVLLHQFKLSVHGPFSTSWEQKSVSVCQLHGTMYHFRNFLKV